MTVPARLVPVDTLVASAFGQERHPVGLDGHLVPDPMLLPHRPMRDRAAALN